MRSRDEAYVAPVLYTAEERRRRDASPWTLVQGILAPLQFLVFLVSLALVLRYLQTGHGESAAKHQKITAIRAGAEGRHGTDPA